MKRKAELMASINEKRKQVLDLLQAGDVDNAKKANDELDKLNKEYNELPIEVERKFKPMDKKEKLMQVRKAVDNYLRRGWNGMSDEDRQVVKPMNTVSTPGNVEDGTIATKGAALVPVETADFVSTMDAGVYRLRDLVQNYFTNTKSGKIPMVANPTDTLTNFDELPSGGMHKTDVTVSAINFDVDNYGDLIPVSNQLLEDSTSSVFDLISSVFVKKNRNTENALIIAAIQSLGAATAVHTWQAIADAVNETDPIDGTDKVIITNTDGGAFLADQVDNDHYVLIQPNALSPVKYFRGYRVIQLPKSQLPNAVSDGAIPFIVGSLYDAVCFVERRGLVITTNPYGDSFAQDGTDVRVTARYDCQPKFSGAVKLLAYTPSN